MASCGEGTQTSTFKNHTNLLAYLANWPLYTGEWLSRNTKGLLEPFKHLFFKKKKTGSYYNMAMCTINYAIMCVGISTICVHSINSFLSTLYITHVINYSRPSTTFPYCKRRKAGWGLGTRLVHYCIQHLVYRRIKYIVSFAPSTGPVPASILPNPTACLQRDSDVWC